jgi:ribosome-associated protein
MNNEYDLDEADIFAEDFDPVISKSQRKRELQHLLQLTEKALSLSDEKLAKTGINDKALEGMRDARRMKPSGARNRLLKYISKLIRSEDVSIIETYLEEAEQSHINEKHFFHQLEKWRDRLIEEGDSAIGDLLSDYPQADRQQLRTLIRSAQKEKQQEKSPASARKLFKYLRELADK